MLNKKNILPLVPSAQINNRPHAASIVGHVRPLVLPLAHALCQRLKQIFDSFSFGITCNSHMGATIFDSIVDSESQLPPRFHPYISSRHELKMSHPCHILQPRPRYIIRRFCAHRYRFCSAFSRRMHIDLSRQSTRPLHRRVTQP